jgi:putative transposase
MFAIKRSLKLNNREATLMPKHAGLRLVVFNMGLSLQTGTFPGNEPLECGLVSQTFTLSKEGSRWFVSFCVDAERKQVQKTQESAGIDLGIKAFATMSKNQVFDAQKPLNPAKNKLEILQRKASKQVKCSKNQRQTYNKMMRIHSWISGSRKELLHKLKTPKVKKIKLIKIRELNVKGMMANPKLGLAISYLGFYEFRRQLEYKCKMYGATRVLVYRWFPRSLTSSLCGNKQDMPPWYQDL